MSISIDLSLVPPTLQTAPLFRVWLTFSAGTVSLCQICVRAQTLELRDNVPDGPHTVGILLELSPQGPVVGFGAGVALGAGLVSLALIFVYCIKRRYCTRKVSSSVPVEPSTISSSTRPNHHRPNTAQFAKLDTVDAASSEIASLSAGGGEGDIEMASRPAPAVQILTTPGALSLVPNPTLRPEEFDTKWQSLLTWYEGQRIFLSMFSFENLRV